MKIFYGFNGCIIDNEGRSIFYENDAPKRFPNALEAQAFLDLLGCNASINTADLEAAHEEITEAIKQEAEQKEASNDGTSEQV